MYMSLHIVIKIAGAAIVGVLAFVMLRLFGVKPLEIFARTGQAADAAAADIREITTGKRHEALSKEISKKIVAGNSASSSDKPPTEDEEMQRELAAERERFLKARRDAVNEARQEALRGEMRDHKLKREKNSRGTGEQ